MATRGEMITRLAGIFGTPEGTVDVLDRALANEGLRARTPRGRALAAMSPLDILHVTLAMTGRRYVRSAAAEVKEISEMPLRDEVDEIPSQRPVPDLIRDEDTFGVTLARIIARLPDDPKLSDLRVIVRWDPLTAEISLRHQGRPYRVRFGDGNTPEAPALPVFSFCYSDAFLRVIAEILRK